ncbi:hypothetical protein HK102_014029 [Quaeritorhiza haematococci]|nr:hypothetical protein HK102_014029 [Quaeritorhiza haematococci]
MWSATSFSLKAIALALLAGSVNALPKGAPLCVVNEQGIAAKHGSPSNPALGYALNVPNMNVAPGTPVDITLTNSAGKNDFNGILLYVTSQKSPKMRFGKFSQIDQLQAAGLKPQTEICQTAGFMGDANAVITHANPSPKPLTTTFRWELSPQDVAADPGPYELMGVVVINPGNWMVLPPVTLMSGGAGAGGAGAGAMPAGAPMPMPGIPMPGMPGMPSMPGMAGMPGMGRKILKCRPRAGAAGGAGGRNPGGPTPAGMPMPGMPMPPVAGGAKGGNMPGGMPMPGMPMPPVAGGAKGGNMPGGMPGMPMPPVGGAKGGNMPQMPGGNMPTGMPGGMPPMATPTGGAGAVIPTPGTGRAGAGSMTMGQGSQGGMPGGMSGMPGHEGMKMPSMRL